MTSNQKFSSSTHFSIKQVVEGIYAAIAKDYGGAISNTGIVDLGEELILFDSFLTPQAASDLRLVLEQSLGKPIRYVINSHYHNDHIRGNQEFSEFADIIATKQCRELIKTKGLEEFEWDKENSEQRLNDFTKRYRSENEPTKKDELLVWMKYYECILQSLPSIQLTIPNITFENKLTLRGSKKSVEIINTGQGHSGNDCVLYVPDEKVLMTGDLVFTQCHPYLADGYPEKWTTVLKDLKNLDIETVIPGHGPIGSLEDIDFMIQYISDLKNIVNEITSAEDLSSRTILEKVPEPYNTWRFKDYFFPINLLFLYNYKDKNRE